jgi:hypothetical protein
LESEDYSHNATRLVSYFVHLHLNLSQTVVTTTTHAFRGIYRYR